MAVLARLFFFFVEGQHPGREVDVGPHPNGCLFGVHAGAAVRCFFLTLLYLFLSFAYDVPRTLR